MNKENRKRMSFQGRFVLDDGDPGARSERRGGVRREGICGTRGEERLGAGESAGLRRGRSHRTATPKKKKGKIRARGFPVRSKGLRGGGMAARHAGDGNKRKDPHFPLRPGHRRPLLSLGLPPYA